jgi:putative photosynthetic complex assembly protein
MTDAATVQALRLRSAEEHRVPRLMVRAMLVLVLSTLGLTTWSVSTSRPLESQPPISPLKAQRMLLLDSDMTGSVRVMDGTGAPLVSLSPEQGGFIAGVHRVILHERGKARLPKNGPVLLQAYENGRMAVIDPTTGWSADLMGFGADNASAFAKLLAQPRTALGEIPTVAPSAQPLP